MGQHCLSNLCVIGEKFKLWFILYYVQKTQYKLEVRDTLAKKGGIIVGNKSSRTQNLFDYPFFFVCFFSRGENLAVATFELNLRS